MGSWQEDLPAPRQLAVRPTSVNQPSSPSVPGTRCKSTTRYCPDGTRGITLPRERAPPARVSRFRGLSQLAGLLGSQNKAKSHFAQLTRSSPFHLHAHGSTSFPMFSVTTPPSLHDGRDKMNGGYETLPSLDQKLESFRRSDQERDALLQEIVRQYEQLKLAFNEKCSDLDNEVQARRYWQSQFNESTRAQAVMRQQADHNPFVLVLIDGDGAIFQDAFLKAGADGGSEAASKLMVEIKNHILDVYEGQAGSWNIIVHIYANLEGLGRKLASVGILRSPQELHTFSRAFSLNQSLFNFIDVGSGKERADHKIKEMLRLFISNIQCKHIIFGGCHDNGYLVALDPYKNDPVAANRISLLETTPAQPAFTGLKFKNARFESVFRLDELPERPVMAPQVIPIKTNSPHQTMSSPVQSIISPQQQPLPPASAPPRTVTPATSTSTSQSWAAVGKTGMTSKSISIAPVKPVQRRYVLLNLYDQRIDEKLPKVERSALERFHLRIQKQKMCNEYHLRGACTSQECPYGHGEKLSPVDRLALQHKARNIACPLLNDCRDVTCYYGHNCPHDECSRGDGCYFAMTHDMDRFPKMKMYEDGTIDILP
ncbi:uncharacterized protein K452DRAFT_289641 [Aplosporella prunicola CBS 121167]|uniref:C3H1-type domain-containing protein n=1 Tax=Aplosporella prunicola CBS 121167 TaxID=1176127 RepID=A0A6A6B8W4_9PEZI|nr:uncharacterized protein K452DRAFT_289641 [Aplosporella prunicola CBS 121167]KAF2139644.1 hypothetical protein K452DRAFT_289641 [Aplosporella prunicola CBS 121167]